MAKEIKAGTQFYREKGLRTLTVHVKPEIIKKLRIKAAHEETSVQELVREALNKFVGSIKG